MKQVIAKLALAAGIVAGLAVPSFARDKITVAYFLEWPTANMKAMVDEAYSKAMDVDVEWRAFGNGNEMTQAMVSGDVQIAYSQGFVPFIVGVTNGAPITAVGVAVTYAENDLCIVRDDSGITQKNAKELEGKKVATPIGNVTYYKLLKSLKHLDVDASKVEMVPMNPDDAALALVRGDVPMACAFGGALNRMRTVGKPLMTGKEQEAAGINTFDVISVTNAFSKKHPELVQKFLEITAKADAGFEKSPDDYYSSMASASGMDLKPTKEMADNFGYLSLKQQASDKWLGGNMAEEAKGVAKVLVDAGNMDKALDSYAPHIDKSFLK